MPRRNCVRGSRARNFASATLTFEVLEIRRPLHAGHGEDEECTIPAALEAIPGDEVLPLGAEPLNSLSSIPALNSLPSAPVDIYLDFDGHYEEVWGSWGNITTPVYSRDSDFGSFSDSELVAIHDIWAQVAEDFAPFHVNVTTVEPPSFDDGVAMRVSIGGAGDWYGSTVGGVGYVNNFTSWITNTVYVFSANLSGGNPKRVAEASSHETGHGFGLEHQSQYNASGTKVAEYYAGANGKAPIMGNSYAATRGLWWNGPNTNGPNSIQDDMARIARAANGFGYRPDDHGNTPGTATQLSGAGGELTASGVISTTSDADYFSFETGAGEVTLTVTVPPHNNLDARLELRSASDDLILFAAPSNSFGATLTANLQGGSYRVVVKSQGNYGDVGQYTLTTDVLAPSVEGVVFADTDRDGMRDDGEAGIFGATVFDDRNGNGVWDAQPQITFTATDTPLAFPAVGTARSKINIQNMPGSIVDLNVRVTLSHPNVGNVLVALIDPAGVTTTLVADLPTTGTSFTSTVFDDQATGSIYGASWPFTGSFKPLGELAPLIGTSPNGEWQLLVTDLTGSAAGVIEHFALEITSSVAEPVTTTNPFGRYLFAFAGTGVHRIRQMPVNGYVVANPSGAVHEIQVEVGSAYTEMNFANVTPGVVGRSLFYDGSKFDGLIPGIDPSNDLAIATDKQAYRAGSGPATFANISSYVRGINGLMIDAFGLDSSISLDDFQFRTGNDSDPDNWQPAPLPIAITVRAGAGKNGSDRIELVWGDDAVKNAWLLITLEGNDAWGGFNRGTGLAASDVFYFGSRIGDTGSGTEEAAITSAADELAVRANPGINQGVTSIYDFDRNGVVSAGDQLIARMNAGLLTKIDFPGSGTPLVANAVASALAIADRDEPANAFPVREQSVSRAEVASFRTAVRSLQSQMRPAIDLTLEVDQDFAESVIGDELLDSLLG